jgi:uncharacterized membrane protein
MNTTPPDPTPADDADARAARLAHVLGGVLRAGVAASILVMLLGLTVSLLRHPDYLWDPEAVKRLMQPGAAFPQTPAETWRELLAGRGRAWMTVGVLLLILTPVTRVAAAVVAFLVTRDWAYTAISLLVLGVLLLSFALGKSG